METGPLSLYNTKTICRYFNKTWYKYKVLSVDVQRIKNNFTLMFDEGMGRDGERGRERHLFLFQKQASSILCFPFYFLPVSFF